MSRKNTSLELNKYGLALIADSDCVSIIIWKSVPSFIKFGLLISASKSLRRLNYWSKIPRKTLTQWPSTFLAPGTGATVRIYCLITWCIAETVMLALGRGWKYRWSFAC